MLLQKPPQNVNCVTFMAIRKGWEGAKWVRPVAGYVPFIEQIDKRM
jgi:hypothetical protein